MADDNNQRPYRPNETRATPQAAPASGNDPLAELARLIGQSDPFAEFGRDGVRRAAPAAPAASSTDWPPQTVNYPASPADPRVPPTQPALSHVQPFGAQNFEQPRYGAASFASGAGLYRTEADATYAAGPSQEGQSGDAYYSGERRDVDEDDFYDDAPPPRRRMGIIAIAAVLGLALIGTAGAIGYRSLFGSSGSSMPPPVIKADTTPSKIVPSTPGKDAQSKLITDRVGDSSRNEKLVSREEQPIQQPSGMAMAPGPDVQPSAPLMPANGSGIVAAEPKKIRTIVIHPDQTAAADVATASSPPPARTEMPVAPPTPVKPAAPRVASVPPPEPKPEPAAAPPEPRPAVSRVAPPVAAAPPSHRVVAANNAPLSLNPGDAAPAAASAPARAAPARAAPQPASGGGYAVQVSSQRSEADATAAFKTMQAKYPGQLGGRSPIIHRVDLGSKGIYFRAMVGPFASSSEASDLCSNLKSAGGQCLVQKI